MGGHRTQALQFTRETVITRRLDRVGAFLERFPNQMSSRFQSFFFSFFSAAFVTQKHRGRRLYRDGQTAVGRRVRPDQVQTRAAAVRAAGDAVGRVRQAEVLARRRVPGRAVRPTGLRDVLLQLEAVEARQPRAGGPVAHRPGTRGRRN